MSNKTPWLVLCNQECISARTNSVTEVWVANNSAVKAGSDLYCGYIKRACFNVTFRLVNVDKGDLSAVSSDPLGMCFCELAKPNCTKRIHYVEVYPGDTLIFRLHVLVGLAFGTIPGVVHATIKQHTANHSSLDILQQSQSVQGKCTTVFYTLSSGNRMKEIDLNPSVPETLYYWKHHFSLKLSFFHVHWDSLCQAILLSVIVHLHWMREQFSSVTFTTKLFITLQECG